MPRRSTPATDQTAHPTFISSRRADEAEAGRPPDKSQKKMDGCDRPRCSTQPYRPSNAGPTAPSDQRIITRVVLRNGESDNRAPSVNTMATPRVLPTQAGGLRTGTLYSDPRIVGFKTLARLRRRRSMSAPFNSDKKEHDGHDTLTPAGRPRYEHGRRPDCRQQGVVDLATMRFARPGRFG